MDASAPADPRKAVRSTLTAASFGFALVQLDVTIVNVALPRIGGELGMGIAGLQWVVDAYALVFATLLLTAGFLGDRFGAKRIYLGGLVLFAVSSLACGLAGSAAGLVVGRAVQGFGAAAMVPSSLTLLNHAVGHDARLRAWAIGWWAASASTAITAGPVLGGLILSVASWRWIFLVNLPIAAVGAVLTARVAETGPADRGRGFDLPGQVLGIVALGALVAAIIEAKPLGPGHPLVVAGVVVGIAATVGFIWAEARAEAPMLPLGIFRAPGFAICLAYGAVANVAYYGLLFVLSLYLQTGLGYDATASGFAFVPLTATFLAVNLLNGPLVGRFGARVPMVGGFLVEALGFVLLLPLGAHATYAAMLIPFMLIPLGMGVAVPATITAVLASVDKAQSGIATAVFNAVRQAGGAMGVAVFGALAGDTKAHVVAGLHASAGLAAALLVSAAALAGFVGYRAR